jgi:hypothetical protein
MAKGKRNQNWKDKVKEWESSNKSPKVWCQENKIPYTTLCGWRNRLKKSGHNNTICNKFVENFIELEDQIPSDSRIILEYQGFKIQLNRDFDKVVLKECVYCLRDALC